MIAVPGFEVLGRAGAGSSATVWKARDVELDRLVALKQLSARTPELSERWHAEARVLASLDDRHVVRVYGHVADEESAYIVEEWIEGATLAVVLARAGELSVEQSLGVLRGALLGLAHAHSRGVVHGDVKPSNVMVDVAGVSRLIDFGVSVPSRARATGGSLLYRSPEASRNEPLVPASDVYSAAVMLAQLLSGDAAATPDLTRVDAKIRPVLARALELDPALRYPTAAEFLAALSEAATRRYGAAWWTEAGMAALVAAATTGTAVIGLRASDERAKRRTGRWPRSRISIAATAAAAAVVGVVVFALVASHKSSSDRLVNHAAGASSATAEPAGAGSIDSGGGLAGHYRVTATVTAVTGNVNIGIFNSGSSSNAKVGDVQDGDLTITRSCSSAGQCHVVLATVGAAPFGEPLTYVSGRWTTTLTATSPCPGAAGQIDDTRTWAFDVPSAASASPASLQGTLTFASVPNPCALPVAASYTMTLALTRI